MVIYLELILRDVVGLSGARVTAAVGLALPGSPGRSVIAASAVLAGACGVGVGVAFGVIVAAGVEPGSVVQAAAEVGVVLDVIVRVTLAPLKNVAAKVVASGLQEEVVVIGMKAPPTSASTSMSPPALVVRERLPGRLDENGG